MDNYENNPGFQQVARMVAALERIATELERLNKEGIVVFGGQTMEEN